VLVNGHIVVGWYIANGSARAFFPLFSHRAILCDVGWRHSNYVEQAHKDVFCVVFTPCDSLSSHISLIPYIKSQVASVFSLVLEFPHRKCVCTCFDLGQQQWGTARRTRRE
jgi:hypothetical protein